MAACRRIQPTSRATYNHLNKSFQRQIIRLAQVRASTDTLTTFLFLGQQKQISQSAALLEFATRVI